MIHRFIFSAVANDTDKLEPVPVIDYERCYNRKQKRHECTVCRDICPKGAIVYKKQLRINKRLCNSCHLCHGVCPTQCISLQGSFIKGINMTDVDALMICCRRCGTGSSGINVPCIASLPWEFYANFSYQTPISIMTEDCSNCEFRAEKYVKAIFERLRLFWGKLNAKKILRHSEISPAKFSRREMMSIFFRRDEKFVHVLMPENKDEEHKKNTSRHRMLLLDVLDEHQEHGWLIWKINQSCWGCQVCEKLCPCQAIQIVNVNGQRMLSHNFLRCIGCQLCKLVCPEKCIEEQIEHHATKAISVILTPVQAKNF